MSKKKPISKKKIALGATAAISGGAGAVLGNKDISIGNTDDYKPIKNKIEEQPIEETSSGNTKKMDSLEDVNSKMEITIETIKNQLNTFVNNIQNI